MNLARLESDPDVMKFTPLRLPLPLEKTRERLQLIIEKQQERSPLGIWAAESIEDGSFIGWFMVNKTQYDHPELGFMLVREAWSKGFATEIAAGLRDFALNTLGYSGLVAVTDEANSASKRVLEKIGFQFARKIPKQDLVSGKEIRLDLFELNAQDAAISR
jgi:RimJ/RimL family protein N-acetyltransferase